MTWYSERSIWLGPAFALVVLFCNGAALAQPGGKGDQPQGKQMEGQGGMMGGMGMT